MTWINFNDGFKLSLRSSSLCSDNSVSLLFFEYLWSLVA